MRPRRYESPFDFGPKRSVRPHEAITTLRHCVIATLLSAFCLIGLVLAGYALVVVS